MNFPVENHINYLKEHAFISLKNYKVLKERFVKITKYLKHWNWTAVVEIVNMFRQIGMISEVFNNGFASINGASMWKYVVQIYLIGE